MMKAARAASSLPAISAVSAVTAVAVVGTTHAEVGELQTDAELHGPVRGYLVEIRGPQGVARQEGEQLLAPGPHGAAMLGAGDQGLAADVVGDGLGIDVKPEILGTAQS